jgi:hypothetical protein
MRAGSLTFFGSVLRMIAPSGARPFAISWDKGAGMLSDGVVNPRLLALALLAIAAAPYEGKEVITSAQISSMLTSLRSKESE